MLEKKSISILIATTMLLAACGGGSDAPIATAGTANTDSVNVPAAVAATPAPPATGAPPANTAPPPPVELAPPVAPATPAVSPPPPPPPPPPPLDEKLNGQLEIVANQVVYIRTNRVIWLPVVLNEFTSDRGIVDVASGSKVADPEIDVVGNHCNVAIDGTCGVKPTAVAPAAPIAAFGIRISTQVFPTTTGQAVGNQKVVGRIAFDLTERGGSPGILSGEVAEIMRFVIDKVELSTNASGKLVSAKLLDGAQIHVYGRNAAGVEVKEKIPAPANTVRLQPTSEIPDNHNDTTSFVLLMDLEAGFSQAGQKLAALEKIAGHFSMHVTFSSVTRITLAGDGSGPAGGSGFAGQSITVNDQPPVTGAGLNGNAWIRLYPM